jgi:hypothetical protein
VVDAHEHVLPPQVHTFGETGDVSRRLIAAPPCLGGEERSALAKL